MRSSLHPKWTSPCWRAGRPSGTSRSTEPPSPIPISPSSPLTPDARSVELVDQTRGFTVRLSWESGSAGDDLVAVCLHRYGIVTVSQSEDGFERIYQGTALLPAWTVRLQEGSLLHIRLRLEVLTG